MFASNTSMQDVTDSLGWSERGLKWTKKIIFGLALEPSFYLALPQLFGGVILWVF